MKKLGWIVLVIVIVGALVMLRVRRNEQKDSAPLVQRAVPTLEVTTVRSGQVKRLQKITGHLVASEQAEVAPRIMAQVLEVRVREGDTVRKGEILAVLDGRELEDSVAQAVASLHAAGEAVAAAEAAWHAERDATERDRVLHEAGAISNEQSERSLAAERGSWARLEAARAELTIARKRHDQALTRRAYALLKAPFHGKVTARHADPGDLAVPGKSVLEVAGRGGLRVRAELPAENLEEMVVGQAVKVSFSSTQVAGTLSRIVPAAGPTGLALFEVDLADAPANFLPGLTVSVEVALEAAEGLIVPVEALLEGENGAWVFLVQGISNDSSGSPEKALRSGRVQPTAVDLLARSLDEAVVAGLLSEGELVILAQPARLMTLSGEMEVNLSESRHEPLPGTGEAGR